MLSCTEDATLDIAQAEMAQQFDANGGIKYVTVKSSVNFTATSDVAWCVPEIYPGGRDYNLGIVVERNELADMRTATVTVAAEGMSELLISISQTGAGPIITVIGTTTVMVDEDHPEFTLEITANLPFTYDLPDWIQPKTGNVPAIGTRLYDFTVLPLPSGETSREDDLIVKATDATVNKSVTVLVKQTKKVDPFDGVKGRWLFEDATDIGKAYTGNDLTISESTVDKNGATQPGGPMSLVTGPKTTDHAVRVPRYSYFGCEHGIAANGGGARINKYTLLMDLKTPELSKYYSLMNTDGESSNQDFMIRNQNTIGGFNSNYSSGTLEANRWYRVVLTVDAGQATKIYLDGELFHTYPDDKKIALDYTRGTWEENSYIWFFNDNDGEDNTIDVGEVAIWDEALDAARVQLLGAAGD
jgi:hypothetical protein